MVYCAPEYSHDGTCEFARVVYCAVIEGFPCPPTKPNMKSFALAVVIGLDTHTVPYPFPLTPVTALIGSNGLAVFAPETPNAMIEITVG